MTRLAIISDVHADLHALRDALTQIERLGCDEILCAGDNVAFGLFPEETIALLAERRITCVGGNHDRWAARDGHDMSGKHLSPGAIDFLSRLPQTWDRVVDGVRVALWHARPGSDMEGVCADLAPDALRAVLEASPADVLALGHTHVPMVIRAPGGRLVANPGTVLRDLADGCDLKRSGTFAILELPSRRFTVHRAADGAKVDVPILDIPILG